MTIQLVEPIIESIYGQRLTLARLNAEIAVTNAEAPATTDPSYVLDEFEPESVLDYIPPPSAIGAKVPMLGLQHGPAAFEDDQGWSATGVYALTFVVFYASAEPGHLARRIRRYARVLARTLLDETRQVGGDPWGMKVLGIDYGDVLGVKGSDQMLTWAAVVVECRHDED
jgi:hypothetical protein